MYNQHLTFKLNFITYTKVRLEEITDWGVTGINLTRSEYGLLFLKINPMPLQYCCVAGTTTYPMTCDINVITGDHGLYFFAVPVWDAAVTYNAGDYVFYIDAIWKSLSTNTGLVPDVNPLHWEEITVHQQYIDFISYAQNPVNTKVHMNSIVYATLPISSIIQHIGCNDYSVNSLSVIVRDWVTGEVVMAIASQMGSPAIIVTLPSDGIYVFTTGGTEYLVIAFCNIEKCYKKLLDSILCTPIDPCCEPCDPANLAAIMRYRYVANMWMTLWTQMMAYIHIAQFMWLGYTQIYYNPPILEGVQEAVNYTKHIADLIKFLTELSDKCGACADELNCISC